MTVSTGSTGGEQFAHAASAQRLFGWRAPAGLVVQRLGSFPPLRCQRLHTFYVELHPVEPLARVSACMTLQAQNATGAVVHHANLVLVIAPTHFLGQDIERFTLGRLRTNGLKDQPDAQH